MTKGSAKHKLKSRLEALASDFVVHGAATPEAIIRFVDGLNDMRKEADEAFLPAVRDAAEMFLAALAELPGERLSEKKDIFALAFGGLQELLAVGDEEVVPFLARLRGDLERALGKSAGGAAGSEPVRLDEIPMFIETASLAVEQIEQRLLELERDLADQEKLRELFRLFHTLKGEAGLLGLNRIVALSHEIEALLEKARSGAIAPNREMVAVVLGVTDVLKEMLGVLKNDVPRALIFDISRATEKVAAFTAAATGADAAEKKTSDFRPSVPVLDLSEGTQMLSEFITESKDHLASAEEALLAFENSSDDAGEINKIFREFHTIKGLASFLNLDDMRILAHDTENMMDLVRRGVLKMTPEVTGIVFASIDAARKLFESLEEQVSHNGILSSPYHDISPVIASIREILGRGSAEKAPEPVVPPKIGEILVKKEIITEEDLETALERQVEAPDEKKIGEILVASGAATASQVERGLQEQKRSIVEDVIRISVKKLDDLIDTTGELVITASQVGQNADVVSAVNAKLVEDVAQLGRIVRNIQGTVMAMRLVPIRPLFQKMLRLGRDLSKKLAKEVDIRLIGEETEIDKNIVDLLADPLVHMVRNAIDHGIELPEERSRRGKEACGRVELSAAHKGGNIIITIGDDGAGIDREKILAKARERGMIKEGEVWEDRDIFNLIFEAGFSTAEHVTEISGRGVGMDVVKKNISQLRGKTEIVSKKGEGTAMTIRLPLTLAIIDGIIMALGQERYIIPIFSVTEFIHPCREDISTVAGRGEMINVHGALFEVVRLDAFFNVSYRSQSVEDLVGCLVESDAGGACIFFDELITQQQVVIKSLGDRLKNIRGLAGATILGDGKVGLILDINGIIEMYQEG